MRRRPLLTVEGLTVAFERPTGPVEVVRDVSFDIAEGEAVALVGESGSGKSVTASAVVGLLQPTGAITGGNVSWRDTSLIEAGVGTGSLLSIRGRHIGMVFQDPMTALNPVFSVGFQIGRVLRRHRGLRGREARRRTTELLGQVGIADPEARARQAPGELSGGMRQRVAIAAALAAEPELLILDEPTTALDVSTQAQVLDVISDLRARLGLAVLLITHDLGVVAQMCERVDVMYAGRLVESSSAVDLFGRPAHPYSAGLLHSTPRLGAGRGRMVSIPGTPPDPATVPPGCPFAPRCPAVVERCREAPPALAAIEPARLAACWRPFAATSDTTWETT